MWHEWATRVTCPGLYIRQFAGYPRTGGAAQDARVKPGFGPWKQTFSRSIMAWTQHGDTPRTEDAGSSLWKQLHSSQGHTRDDDDLVAQNQWLPASAAQVHLFMKPSISTIHYAKIGEVGNGLFRQNFFPILSVTSPRRQLAKILNGLRGPGEHHNFLHFHYLWGTESIAAHSFVFLLSKKSHSRTRKSVKYEFWEQIFVT